MLRSAASRLRAAWGLAGRPNRAASRTFSEARQGGSSSSAAEAASPAKAKEIGAGAGAAQGAKKPAGVR